MDGCFLKLSVISDELHLSENRIIILKLRSLWGTFTLSTMRKLGAAEDHTDPIEINFLSKEELGSYKTKRNLKVMFIF